MLPVLALGVAGCGSQTGFPINPAAAKRRVGEVPKQVRVTGLTTANIGTYSTPRNLSGPRTDDPLGGALAIAGGACRRPEHRGL